MSTTAEIMLQKFEKMNDFQLLRFFDYFSNGVFGGLNVSLEEIMASMPAEQQLMPEVLAAQRLDNTLAGEAIPKAEAVQFARNMLSNWANTPSLSKLLEAALDQYRDTEQSADVILAIGAAISMVLLTFGQGNIQLQAFGISVNINRGISADKSEVSSAFHSIPITTQKILNKVKRSPVVDLMIEGRVKEALELLETTMTGEDKKYIYVLLARYQSWETHKEEGRFPDKYTETSEYNHIIYAITSLTPSA